MATAARTLGMWRLMPSVLPIMFGRTTLAQQPDLVAEWGGRMASMHLRSMLTCLDSLNGREAILDRLAGVDVPALVLVGEEDKAQHRVALAPSPMRCPKPSWWSSRRRGICRRWNSRRWSAR